MSKRFSRLLKAPLFLFGSVFAVGYSLDGGSLSTFATRATSILVYELAGGDVELVSIGFSLVALSAMLGYTLDAVRSLRGMYREDKRVVRRLALVALVGALAALALSEGDVSRVCVGLLDYPSLFERMCISGVESLTTKPPASAGGVR